MADWSDLAGLAKELVNELGDTTVTLRREADSYDAPDPQSSSWTGKGVFDFQKSMAMNSVWQKVTAVTIPVPDNGYVPAEGDLLDANGRTWTVNSILDGGVGQALYYELVLKK